MTDATEWKSPGYRKLFLEALSTMLTVAPPIEMVNDYMDTDDCELQEWCVNHLKLSWSTGIGTIDAAYSMVTEARANANIDDYGNIK